MMSGPDFAWVGGCNWLGIFVIQDGGQKWRAIRMEIMFCHIFGFICDKTTIKGSIYMFSWMRNPTKMFFKCFEAI